MNRVKVRGGVLGAMVLLAVGCAGDDGSAGSTSSTTGTSGPATSTTAPPPTTGSATTAVDTSGGGTSAATTTTTGGPVVECPYEEVAGDVAPALELVAAGCDRPVHAVGHPDQPDRLFVVEQGGKVRIVEPGSGQCGAVFLEVDSANKMTAEVENGTAQIGNEQGLLGFALHPNFPADPRVYVNYTPAGGGRTVVEEYALDPANPDQVDPASARTVMEFCQPAGNHNGGMLLFDSTGMLLITTGDGGVQFDGLGNGRDPSQVLGKVLRIDVEPDGQPHDPAAGGCTDVGPQSTYGIPADNPFVGDPSFTPEVYAWGFRNPWRASIDPPTNRLYVADVGQGEWEEVDVVEAGSDYGWGDMEGRHCLNNAACDDTPGPGQQNADGQFLPIAEYPHSGANGGCSITGGSVYRSCQVPAWDGLYFYGDYCSGLLHAVLWDGSTAMDFQGLLDTGERLIGNGWNAWGDVYLTSVDTSGSFIVDGHVYRIAPQ